jgi:hypothetical protein
MSKLAEAIERLERAVARLEAAPGLGGRHAEPPQASPSAERDAENLRLRETAGQIAARVDGALAKIRQVLREES